jgi:hypothetical protein
MNMEQNSVNTISTVAVISVVQGLQKYVPVPDLDSIITETSTTQRDHLRQAFFDQGIEIEFSGKGAYEKGVVIDMDTDRMQELGLDSDVLRFGQTVVRVEDAH